MATSSIGATSRDYATPALWEDDIDGGTLSAPEIGEMYNDAEFTGATSISGTTTSATNYIKLTTATGESFMDDADADTNALAYNQSKGVGIAVSTGWVAALDVRDDYVAVEKIQIKRTSTTANSVLDGSVTSLSGLTFKNVIVEQSAAASDAVRLYNTGNKIVNSLIITYSTSYTGLALVSAAEAHNVTVVSPSDVTHTINPGVKTHYSGAIVKNVCSFGFNSGFSTSGFSASSDYNASDDTTSPGSNSQDSLTYADQFETITTSGRDFRVKSGSDLESNGTRDQTNTDDLDIIGQDRDTSTPTIGCWEFVSAATSAGVTGTATASIDEADIVTGGKTIILTLTGDTWAATVGADNAITTALIAGIDSAQSEAAGWDAVVKANMDFNDVTRTSATVVTITLGAESTYDITAQETITVTVPATALVTSGTAVVATPTFTVDAVAGVSVVPPALHGLDNQFSQITANRLNGVLQ